SGAQLHLRFGRDRCGGRARHAKPVVGARRTRVVGAHAGLGTLALFHVAVVHSVACGLCGSQFWSFSIMPDRVVLLSIPGLREQDLAPVPTLAEMAAAGDQTSLVPSFPAVTCPVQANMTTGKLPSDHGVIANGFYWRDKQQVEMWTAWNECIGQPQI